MSAMIKPRSLLPAILATCCFTTAMASPLHGVLKYGQQLDHYGDDSLAVRSGHKTTADTKGDVRLMGSHQQGAWSSKLHLQTVMHYGDAVELQNAMASTPGLANVTPDQTNAFKLDHRVSDTNSRNMDVRVDRLSLMYSGTHAIARLGRQALTWGVGMVFHPMDLFNPFAPNALETDYKPGVDMLYGQWLFDNGSDIQGLVVPRRDIATDDISREASAAALRYRHAGALGTTLLLARDYGDSVMGASFSGNWAGRSWNIALVPTIEDGGNTIWSGLVNLTDAQTWWGKSVTLTAEYFHNGFGQGGNDYSLADLSQRLVDRLSRGQAFVTGKNYLAGVASMQWTPLWTVDNSLIVNLGDQSLFWFLHMNYSISDNVTLLTGAQIPIGPSGTEFGGLPLTQGNPVHWQTPRSAFVRFEYYF